MSPPTWSPTLKMEANLDDALILITDKKISNIQELLPVLEQVVQSGKLLIIAEDVEGRRPVHPDRQRLRGTLNVVCVKPPASATAARRCSRISPSSPAALSPPTWAWS